MRFGTDLGEGGGEQLGVAEGVAHAEAGDGVPVVAGVADERPPRAGGDPQLVRQSQRAPHGGGALGAPQPLGQRRRPLGEHPVEGAADVGGLPAHRLGDVGGRAHPGAGLAVVGGEDPGEGAVVEVVLEAEPVAAVVRVVDGPGGGPGEAQVGADRAGHARPQPVGPDDQAGPGPGAPRRRCGTARRRPGPSRPG